MPKILLYAVIGVLGVIVLKSLVAPKLPQTVVVTPKNSQPWWASLIGAGADAYKQIWGSSSTSASPTPAPASTSSAGADDYLTPDWLS